MSYRKSTKYSQEEIDKIREEYITTSITIKGLIEKYNISNPVLKTFSGLKDKFPKLNDRSKEEWDRIIEYYKTNKVSHSDMKKLFNLTDYQCNTYLSFTRGNKKLRVYTKYSEEEWINIIKHYTDENIPYRKIKEIYNVSDTDMNLRFKGLKSIDLRVGLTLNRLTIIDINVPFVLSGTQWRRMVRVRCECGNEFDTKFHDFKLGRTKSCGCLLKKSLGNTFYSKDNTPEGKRTYISFSAMRKRCYYVNGSHYPSYGGRGITICDRWMELENGYKNFLEDMGYRPEGMTLDRIDVNGNYEPSNCRWATISEQTINQRRYSHIKQYTDEEWENIKKDYYDNRLSYDEIIEKYSVSKNQCVKRLSKNKKDVVSINI